MALAVNPVEGTVPQTSKISILIFIYACIAMDAADASVLAGVFSYLEHDFRIGPSILGQLALAQYLSMSLGALYWSTVRSQNRLSLLGFGLVAWSITSCLVSLAWNVPSLALLRALNGFFLSMVTPVAFELLSSLIPSQRHGAAFGLVNLVTRLGGMAGRQICSYLDDWRASFCVAGVMGLIVLVPWFRLLSRRQPDHQQEAPSPPSKTRTPNAWKERSFWSRVISRTLLLINIQGMLGCIPWKAFDLLMLYFVNMGYSPNDAAVHTNALHLGAAIGGIVGGIAGDAVHTHHGLRGRILLVIFANSVRLPLLWYSLTSNAMTWLALTGFFAAWIGTANMALVAAVTPTMYRGAALGLNSIMEGVVSSLLGTPLVGWIAESVYGYTSASGASAKNALALQQSILHVSLTCWTFNLLLFCLILFTYKSDQERANHDYTELSGDQQELEKVT